MRIRSIPRSLAFRVTRALQLPLQQAGRIFQKRPSGARLLSVANRQIFFGYYDITPFSADSSLILAGSAPAANVSPHGPHPDLDLGFFDLMQPGEHFTRFATTTTWNWQQGCRLQWYPGADGERLVLYNTLEQGRYTAVIQDVREVVPRRTLPAPVYSLSPDGMRALTLNFSRLHRYRAGYGYSNLPDTGDPNGVSLIDVADGRLVNLLSMETIMAFEPRSSMTGATHYLNHLCFSPSGNRFMVMHLWLEPGGKRNSRMLVADQYGNLLACPNNEGSVSHYFWGTDDEIILTGRHADGITAYYRYNLAHGTRDRLAAQVLDRDGHPSLLPGNRLLTDTYPDQCRLQSVLICDLERGSAVTLARFYMPLKFTGEARCDLHPRLNRDATLTCVDHVVDGRRALCVFAIPPAGG